MRGWSMSLPINTSRWQNKVRAMFGLQGDNPVPTLRDLLPVAIVENDRPESRVAGGDFLVGAFGTQAAGAAGTTSQIALINPVKSGLVGIVVGVLPSVVSNMFRLLGPNELPSFTAPTGTAGIGYRDSRAGLTPAGGKRQPGLQVLGFTNAAIAGFEWGSTWPGNWTILERIAMMVLWPGSGFSVHNTNQVQAITANWLLYERMLESGF